MTGRNRRAAVWTLGVLFLGEAAAAQAVKISQVFGGGGNPGAPYNRDYIELFNAGATDMSLAGWSLQYATAAGVTWQSIPLPAATMAPGSYYLVQVSSVGTVGEPLPQPDHAANPGIAMTSTSGKVALVNSTAVLAGACPTGPQIVDFVGFGASASCFEGAGPAPAPSNTAVLLRVTDGCTDSGENATDFIVGPAAPRNSAISRAVCPGADLSVTLETAGPQLMREESNEFTVRVRNLGPDTAESVSVTIQLPANAALAASEPPAVPVDGLLMLGLGDLALDEEAVVSLSITPFSGTHATLSARASAVTPDLKPGNSTVSSTLPIFDYARATLFVGVLDPGGQLRAVDVESGASRVILDASISGLAADNSSRRFFITDGATLSIVPWSTMTARAIGAFTGNDVPIRGLAWHPNRRQLLGVGGAKIYEIDLQSAAARLVRTLPGGDFVGVDHDPASNRLFATNNSTAISGDIVGRGIYRINPFASEVIRVSTFPDRSSGFPETDIDACAVGAGRIYAATDQAEWIYRYQQSISSFLAPLGQPLDTDHIEAGATFAPEFYSQSPGANVGVEISTPRDCEAIGGRPLTLQITAHNFGPSYAVAPTLTVPLPAGTTLIGSAPAVVPIDGVMIHAIAGLAPGESSTIELSLLPSGSSVAITAAVAAVTTDPLPLNNTASRTVVMQAPLPAVPAATVVLSTLPGSNTVPGSDGVTIATSAPFGRLFRSPSGSRWLLAATITGQTIADRVLIRGGPHGLEIAAQEGVSFIQDVSAMIGEFGPVYSINEAGDLAFTTDIDPDPQSGILAVKSLGGSLSVIAEQGSGNLPMDSSYGAAIGSLMMHANGTASLVAQFPDAAGSPQALLADDGLSILAQTGATQPTGQLASPPAAIESIPGGLSESQVTWRSASGDRWAMRADLAGPAATDLCLVINNEVRIQEGYRIPGSSLTSNVAAIHATDMDTATGTVFCRGTNADGKDWVWREGAVIASTGAPIAQGSIERFADSMFARCFTLASGNSAGDFIVGGHTDAADVNANEVIVLNNERVLLRENDVLDIDGDGEPDGDARIHSFVENSAFVSDHGWLFAIVRVRSSADVCRGTPVEIGQALIRKRVVCAADFNRDGGANVPDIFAFLSAWFAQQAAADSDGDGAIGVPDIFAFLSLWFEGC